MESDFGKIISPGVVRFERRLPKPIERIWAYLADSDKREKWLARGNIELFIGGNVNLHFLHKELSPVKISPPEKFVKMEAGHSFSGKVLAVSPPKILSFTWEDNSEVNFELVEEENHILLALTHRKLPPGFTLQVSVCSGWHTHLGILKDKLEQRIPKNFWTVYTDMELTYVERLKSGL